MSLPLAITTRRLQLRWLNAGDAAFIHRLVNDADWLRFIGDKRVASLDDARRYIETGPAAMYRQHGFGLNCVALKTATGAIGICGLLRREDLADVDLGFAFLPEYRGRGYAREAAGAVLAHASEILNISRVVAIVSRQNAASVRLLENLGFARERRLAREPGRPVADLYRIELSELQG